MKPITKFPDIAFIMPSLADMQPSGVTTFVRQMANGFERRGDHFRIVEIPHGSYEPADREAYVAPGHAARNACGRPAALSATLWAGIAVAGGPPTMRAKPIFVFFGYLKLLWVDFRRVWAVRAQCKHRIILTNQFGCETLPVALRLVFPFARIVAISHTHPGHGVEAVHWVRRWVEQACYWSLTDILYNSDSSRREWAGKLGVTTSKGGVLYLGTEPPNGSVPSDYPERQPDTVDFLCVARFVSWKGQGHLIRVWQKVISRGERRARLIFIGDGPCLDVVRRDAEEAGIGCHVIFLGAKPNADRYFNAADVAVLLSSEPEAFGLTLLEAMSRGKPVLASNIGGIPEIVVDGDTGILVNPHEDERGADGVCLLTASASERQRLGSNARKRWDDHFTVERMVCRYESYFMGQDGQEPR